ncbi:hypothetical protein HID58_052925 [Brassica napus]|uniref:Uncharacterized protein n=1 Tax=Brassica napus TaxID=3708 RepID=A0ABQ8AEC9_BRANA|nr:hypothetical protein HID58_052925 [Brassica napus]
MERYQLKRDSLVRETCNDCELDLLYLVHSGISSLLHQIDELVVKATKLKTMSKQGKREVESFRSVLSNMHSSLKVLTYSMVSSTVKKQYHVLNFLSLVRLLLSSGPWSFLLLLWHGVVIIALTRSALLMTPFLKMSPPKSSTLFKPVLEPSQPGKQGGCKFTCSELGSQSSGSSSEDLLSKYHRR